jgi:hypothetical protein
MTVSSVIRDKARALLLAMSGQATFEEASLHYGLDAAERRALHARLACKIQNQIPLNLKTFSSMASS